ncbi:MULTISPECIES: cell division protein ZipA C-terminal FtsZ-binding domain-containing protein [unclassified Thioalkalivibrio]|uniref:cell division protein ZipA C-terminal FtsZ-binding domain-containing protein n=1 Tax=unclassified Thioalkalivibrio TaxID=2621013 RepID=UPI000367F0C4|nr:MULTISPECIES: cell division protein ZipA C-terminal FtsZ-binding domain-containing protein [unclassified Thioalkalivibrio]
MRISLVILGIVLVAGIWMAHRLRTRDRAPDLDDDATDWSDDAVHIRAQDDPAPHRREGDPDHLGAEAGWADPLEASREYTRDADTADPDEDFDDVRIPQRDRAEPHLGVTSADDGEPLAPGERHADRAQDIYGVLDNDEEPVPPPPHGAFEPDPEDAPRRRRAKSRAAETAKGVMDQLSGRMRSGIAALRGTRLRRPRAEETLGEQLHPDHEVDPELIEEPAPDMETLGEYVSEPRVVGRNPLRGGPGSDEKILLLHVVAPRNRPFTGVALGAALQRAGLKPGAMDIYHYHDAEIDSRQALFSAANMVPPGTLREQDLADTMTPGITLFVQVHNSADPQRAFEALLENAHGLARDLGGSILDAQQSTATNQTLAYMREDLNEWLMRHRPDLLRRRRAR